LRAEIAESAGREGLDQVQAFLLADCEGSAFIGACADLSPYLADTSRRKPGMLDPLLHEHVGSRFDRLPAQILDLAEREELADNAFMDALRALKREAHCLISLDDLGRNVTAATTVHRLSLLADACIRSSVRHILRDAHRQGKLRLPDPDEPEAGSGWILLAMG